MKKKILIDLLTGTVILMSFLAIQPIAASVNENNKGLFVDLSIDQVYDYETIWSQYYELKAGWYRWYTVTEGTDYLIIELTAYGGEKDVNIYVFSEGEFEKWENRENASGYAVFNIDSVEAYADVFAYEHPTYYIVIDNIHSKTDKFGWVEIGISDSPAVTFARTKMIQTVIRKTPTTTEPTPPEPTHEESIISPSETTITRTVTINHRCSYGWSRFIDGGTQVRIILTSTDNIDFFIIDDTGYKNWKDGKGGWHKTYHRFPQEMNATFDIETSDTWWFVLYNGASYPEPAVRTVTITIQTTTSESSVETSFDFILVPVALICLFIISRRKKIRKVE